MSIAESARPGIDAALNYIVDDGRVSVRYVDWPEMKHEEHIAPYEARMTRIADGRKAGEPFDLPTHGFRLLDWPTLTGDFADEDKIRRIYYPETAALIAQQSGGRLVHVFDHTIRSPVESRQSLDLIRGPVNYVHNDYTERSAPQRVRDFFPGEADTLLSRRYAIIQTWRSIAPYVESTPIAMCDGKTIPETGFIRNERRYRYRTAETYHITYNPAHRWYYFPRMAHDEVLVFKVFDSDSSSSVRFTAHSAFDDPATPADAAPRESIEMRALVFW